LTNAGTKIDTAEQIVNLMSSSRT